MLIAALMLSTPVSVYKAAGRQDEDSCPSAETQHAQELASAISEHDKELGMLARLIYTEARGVDSDTEQAAVAWCVLNRVDSGKYPDSIAAVIRDPHQFAWEPSAPVTDKFKAMATDVFVRWTMEQQGYQDVGRVLPKEYIFFAGSNGRNRFRTKYHGGTRWNWSAVSPYED